MAVLQEKFDVPANQCITVPIGSLGDIKLVRIENEGLGDFTVDSISWTTHPLFDNPSVAGSDPDSYSSEVGWPTQSESKLVICAVGDVPSVCDLGIIHDSTTSGSFE